MTAGRWRRYAARPWMPPFGSNARTTDMLVHLDFRRLALNDVENHVVFRHAPLTQGGRRFLLEPDTVVGAHEVAPAHKDGVEALVLKVRQTSGRQVLSTSPRRVTANRTTGHIILMTGAVVTESFSVQLMRRMMADILVDRPYDHIHAPGVLARYDVRKPLRIRRAVTPSYVEEALDDVRL